MLRKLIVFFAGLFVVMGVSACSIPFSVDAPEASKATSVDIPNTAGIYVERKIDIPAEARKPGITITEVVINYTITKTNGTVGGELKLYASSDTNADNVKGANDEMVLDKTLSISQNSVSGTAVSEKIKEALNNKQDSFVIGVENLSLGTSLNLTLYTTISGTANPFEMN